MLEETVEKVKDEKKEQLRFSVEDAQNILEEETQKNIQDGKAEIQEVLDRRNLRMAISMLLLEDGRNIPNAQLVPRQE